MKITDPKGIAQPLEKPVAKPSPKNGNAVESTVGGSINISAMSSQLSALEAQLGATPQFDTGRVDSIKQAIREGRFNINPEAIADKLLANVEEILKKPH